jgi:hypothetical protein
MGLPTSIEAPRHRSAPEIVAEQLGGEHHLRQLLAAIGKANVEGGPIRIEWDAEAGSGRVLRVPVILHGRKAW